ncbi:Na+/H+ antiporter NhaA [Cellulomonas endophytica]|uniref:Na+/H+ antiporter NhaA n=1 Tax=Cellulomonas endophytica TaxID=2494735 RepID=UPI00196AA0BF|nr:Na+/H+ antiporter NhaA [Cellulomonas endophytica]
MTAHAPAPSRNPVARFGAWAAQETTGGLLLIGAAVLALVWANSPARDGYAALAGTRLGPEALHLDLTLSTWAADGLLAIFFLVVGLELKQEIVAGSLRNPRQAGVPVLAAVGGMAVPALLYLVLVQVLGDPAAAHGWAIPAATDIAFALAVLAIFGRGLPAALRTFLLTLAVVDDLLAIVVIAAFYSSGLVWGALAGSAALVAVIGVLVRRRRPPLWLVAPLAVVAWVLMHESGVHATIAGVLVGLVVPARPVHGEALSRTERWGHAWSPVSAGFALPVFAFFSAGVNLVDGEGVAQVLGQPVVAAVLVGLVVGKVVGVLGTTALVTRLTPLRLADAIGLRDLLPVGLLAGIGFTVSLLVAELSFPDSEHTDGAKIAILLASLLAAVLGALTLRWDARRARDADMNRDGVPDVDVARIGDVRP